MTTLIERAIEAAEKELLGHVDPYTTNMSDYGVAQNVVRAVLTAIREPSEGMIEAVDRLEPRAEWWPDEPGDRNTPVQVWQAMIDAALAENP